MNLPIFIDGIFLPEKAHAIALVTDINMSVIL